MGEYEGKKPNKTPQQASHAPTTPVVGRSPLHEGPTSGGEPAKSEARGSVFASGKLPWSGESGHDRVAAPDAFDFGDLETTESRIENVFVFNQHREPATVSAMLDAGPSLQIVERPSLLRPSHEGFDPASAFRIAYTPHTTAVDDGKLVVALRWSDGVTQTIRIQIKAAAHLRSEPTHAEKSSQVAQAKQEADTKATQAAIGAAHETKVREMERRSSGVRLPIHFGYETLVTSAEQFFANQALGVSEAAGKVSLYSRRQASASVDPPIAITIIKAALDIATGRLSSLVSAGFAKLAKSDKFTQWGKGTTLEVETSTLNGFSGIIASVLSSGNRAIQNHVTWQPDQKHEAGDPSGESQVDFFTQQVKALNKATADRKKYLLDLERALMPLNTPELADLGREILLGLASLFESNADQASDVQAYETTRQWARFVSHANLGSVPPDEAKKKGLMQASDGGPTAKMDKALLGSSTHAGVLDIEFSAELLHPSNPVRITTARLFGLSAASVGLLKLDQQPLRSAGLPMRLRSTAASSPLSVTVTRDEAGNVQYVDESGAPGMATPWLSRRGHGRDDAAAHRAAKELIQSIESQTLRQLGVGLELDDA